jgi:hypothetical protein
MIILVRLNLVEILQDSTEYYYRQIIASDKLKNTPTYYSLVLASQEAHLPQETQCLSRKVLKNKCRLTGISNSYLGK